MTLGWLKKTKGISTFSLMIVSIFLMVGFMMIGPTEVMAEETLRFSCSAQVYEALRGEGLSTFTEKTGVKVKAEIVSSGVAIQNLIDGKCDIAASAQRLGPDQKSKGLKELPFAKDAIIIIANPINMMRNLTLAQVREVFSGKITNASQVGGRDIPLTVITPVPETALFNNFNSLFMGGEKISYDITTTQSTFVKSLTRRIKGGISFVNQAATSPQYGRPVATKMVTVDGLGPDSEKYPYHTIYTLVIKGEATGPAKKFVDFIFSDEFAQIINGINMTPCPCPE